MSGGWGTTYFARPHTLLRILPLALRMRLATRPWSQVLCQAMRKWARHLSKAIQRPLAMAGCLLCSALAVMVC